MFFCIFSELQITVLLLVCTVYLREMHLLRREKNYHTAKYRSVLLECP